MEAFLTAVVWVAAGLLVVAGAAKLRTPDPAMALLHRLRLPSGRIAARLVGLAEVATGITAIAMGGRLAAAGLAALYAVFAAVAETQRRRQQSCGCFGASDVATTRLHVVVDGLLAGVIAAGAAVAPPASLDAVTADAGAWLTAVALLLGAAAVGALRTLLVSHGRALHAATLRRRTTQAAGA